MGRKALKIKIGGEAFICLLVRVEHSSLIKVLSRRQRVGHPICRVDGHGPGRILELESEEPAPTLRPLVELDERRGICGTGSRGTGNVIDAYGSSDVGGLVHLKEHSRGGIPATK